MNNAVIEGRGLHVDLDGTPVLRGVDVHVDRGEVVTLLGANGSGKSTLVRALIGLVPVSAGEVSLFGHPLKSFEDWRQIGYVPQRATAAGGVPATVREVVASGRLSRRRPFVPASRADREAVDRAIELVGLTDRAGSSVTSLSGGQQQRTLIARAAAAGPDLLVLDEPNAGVDQRSQQAFARALRTFVASGRTVLVVLHEMGPLAPMIDRGIVLDRGQVVHDGALARTPQSAGVADDHHHDGPTGWFG